MSDWRHSLPIVLATSLFWISLFGLYLLFNRRYPPAQAIQIIPPATQTIPTPQATATPAPLRVYVSGAVLSPGVYRLPPDSLVADAIDEAGGHTDDADLVAINLAHPLRDGEQIYVPTRGEQAPPLPLSTADSFTASSAETKDQNTPLNPVDLNTASAEELEALPGIGPKTAAQIIDNRPYSSVEDLLRVKGIGEKTLNKLRPYITVQ